jgi:drug/metabolite transporter (DMT)-like permease
MAANMSERLEMGRREWALLALLSLVWGGSFFFIKIMVRDIPPLTMVTGRVLIAALALNAVMRFRGERLPRDAAVWRSFLLLGLINNVIPFTLIVFGETRISSGLASILNATTPIFILLIAHLWTPNEKLSGGKLLGVTFGFCGVATLIGPAALSMAKGSDLLGETSCLLAALSYAFAAIYGRRFSRLAPLTIATGQISASALILLPLSLAIDRPWTLALPAPSSWLALLGIALLSTAFAYLLYFRILAAAGATNVLLVTFLVPISALLLGCTILQERLSGTAAIGMLSIGVGLAAIDGRLASALATHFGARFRPQPRQLHERIDE